MNRVRRSFLAAALVVGAPALAAWVGGVDDGEKWRARLVDDGRQVELADVSGNDCLECHADIGAQWRMSAHATAWQDEHFQRDLLALPEAERAACHGCHAPTPLVPAGLPQDPAVRATDPHLGVDCRACHLDADGETILGTLGLETDAHPTRVSDHLAPASMLCVSCHATTVGPVIGIAADYVATDQAEVESCVGCHMPMARGPLAVDPEGEAEYEVRRYRSHRLESTRDPKFLKKTFGLDVETRDGRAVVTISNRAGHGVPGLTTRTFTFVARVLDESGAVLDEAERVLDHESPLPVDDSVEVELSRSGSRVVVEGLHLADGMSASVVFVKRTFQL